MPDRELPLLYIGSLSPRSNSYRRFEALANLARRVHGLNSDPYIMARFFAGLQHYYNVGIGIIFLNRRVRKQFAKQSYRVVWVDNKPYLSRRTLKYIKKKSPATLIVNLLTDDPFGEYRLNWTGIKKTASLYDYFFVQREPNIDELQRLGVKHVGICYRSYAPDYNRPVILDEKGQVEYGTRVGFVGTYERSRAEFIAFLIKNGIPVSVRGDGWVGKKNWKIISPWYKGPSVYGEDYIKTINGMEIALHFLRKGNRDEQDSRTFEIPSCRVFMLAEYSEAHARLFSENEEAVFFRSKEGLLEKVTYYMNNVDERKRIAENGFRRCIGSGYDHEHTLQRVLTTIGFFGNGK